MDNEKFYKQNAVYQIYPRSFYDANGDGIGDIQGITAKLDYLQSLGVGILWLSPVYPSPNVDYGYDISNYMDINPEYGIMANFEDLIREAGKRKIRIVMDLVINHTSNQHPWFKASKDPKSPYRDYYIWRKGRYGNTKPPNNWKSNFTGSAWQYDDEAKSWYLHLFSKEQPDLNWKNPEVFREIEKIILFWLDKGVYGFRCDVINEIYKTTLDDGVGKGPLGVRGSEHYLNQEGCHSILHKLYKDIFENRDGMLVGETPCISYQDAKKFTEEELNMVFSFDHTNVSMARIMFRGGKPHSLVRYKEALMGWQTNLDWNAVFFENHDQLRSIDRYGDRGKFRVQSAKMIGLLNLFLRGTPFIYQGQELGMVSYKPKEIRVHRDLVPGKIRDLASALPIPRGMIDNLCYFYNRDNARSPMQWSEEKNAGFSKADDIWLPVNENYEEVNASSEEADPDSVLSFYKDMLVLRKTEPALAEGSIDFLPSSSSLMLFTRKKDADTFLICVNLTKKHKRLHLHQGGHLMLAVYADAKISENMVLRPYEGFVLKLD